MSGMPYLHLHVRDYIVDTMHLSVAESGLYLHLLMRMWINAGYVDADDSQKMCAMLHLSIEEWERLSPSVLKLCTRTRKGWTQKRLLQELSYACGKSAKRRAAGKKGGTARALKLKEEQDKQCSSIAQAPTPTPTPIVSKKERTPSNEGVRKKEPPPDKPAARARHEKPPGSVIDPDRKPSEADIAYARRHGWADAKITDRWEHFVAFHVAKGDTSKSWPHSWQTWVKNDRVYGRGPPMQRMAARRTRMDDVKELIAEGWLDHVED